MAKGLKLYSFDELDKAAQEVAIEKVRDDYYSGGGNSTDFAEWAVDDDYLFEISQKEKDELFGEGAKAIANSKYGDEPIIGNTRKNIYFDTDRNSHLDASEAIEINNDGMFLTWLGIPKEMQDNVHFTIKSDGSRNADTIIEFEENDSDTEFTAEELSILEDAEQKFKDHMSDVLKSIEKSIDYRYSEEAIREDLENDVTSYTFLKSGKIVAGFDDEDTDEMRAGGSIGKQKIKVRYVEEDEIKEWTIDGALEEINRDRSNDWTDYNTSDWLVGWNDWIEDDGYYSLNDKNGKPLNDFKKMRDGGDVDEPFVVHGYYTVSNSGGYEIMLSDSGDAARVRDAFGSDNPETSDWLEIQYVEDENGEPDEEGFLPSEPVIDPEGYNIPLNLVMRSNFKKGGNMKQSKAQNFIGAEKYGASDRKRSAKPVGYRYMRIFDKTKKGLRAVTKKDRQYYLTPTASEIKAYEAGDKMARKMIYFERRADHSDKNLSGKGFAKGGGVKNKSCYATYNELRYEVFVDGKSIYEAGNNPLDSASFVSAEKGVGKDKMKQYAEQTGKEIAEEHNCKFEGVQYEKPEEFAKGGGMKQSSAQYGHDNYGSGDKQKYAKPVGYRYKKVRVSADKNRLRPVTKDDKKYYQTPTNKDIKAYEAGDKTARKMLYFENRKDHSDKEPLRSLQKYAKGGGVTIGEYKAKYQVKFKLKDDDKLQLGYIVQVMTPSRHAIDHYLLFNKSKELVKKLSLQESQNLVNDKKMIKVKGYDNAPEFAVESNIPVKDMGYSELKFWIEENILPHLKSASLEWRSYEGGTFDINDDKSNKEFIDEVRKSADYSSTEEFTEKTDLILDDSGWGIATANEAGEGEELEEVSADNSYNWSYLGLMDWNFRVYKESEEKYYLVAHPHMGGDVRGNYGDPVFFEAESEEAVLYKFRETVIDGGREVRFTFKDKTELLFSAQQDSDVSYFEYQEGHGGKKIKAKSTAELLLSTFETFGSWNGDNFLENIVDAFIASKKKKKELGGGLDNTEEIKERLEYLRGELREERISQGELIELESLVKYIDKDDIELLQAAGVPEFEDNDDDDDDEYADGGEVQKINMGNGVLMDLEDAIKMYQDKIQSQGRIVNERDENMLKQLKGMRNKFSDGGQLSSDMAGKSLSNGTLKTEHLIDAFMDFLQSVKVKLGIEEQVNKIQDEIDTLEKDEDGDFVGDSEETATFILNDDIFDLLISISPEGTSFGSHEGNGSDFGFWEYENEDDEDEYRSGGSVKSKANARQKKQQYGDRDVEKYGGRDGAVQARPVGYRYRKVRKPSGVLRDVNKGDKQYYNSPTQKDIKAYEAGDKTARKMIYYEDRKDHSDRNPHSNRKNSY